MFSPLATGHPAIPTAGDIDFVPLLYAALLFLALWRTRIPIRIWVLPIVLLLGGLIDSIANATHVSSMTVIALLILLAVLVPRRRTPAGPQRPPAV
jgi:hypothetical protein